MVVFWAVFFVSLVSPPRVDNLYNRLTAATVWLRAGDRGVGTGWVVDADRKWVVTARHVVADQDSVEVFFPDQRTGKLVVDRQQYLQDREDLERAGLYVRGRVIGRRDASDLALIELPLMPKGIPAIPLATERAIASEACSLVGHRHDSESLWTFCTGAIRQTGRLTHGYFSGGTRVGQGVDVVYVQCPVEAGDSGAALADKSGRVFAVLTAFKPRTPGVAIGVDVSEVRQLLADARKDKDRPLPSGAAAAPPAYLAATVWVRPSATDTRAGGVLIDLDRRLVLTSSTGVGPSDLVDVVFPTVEGNRIVAEQNAYADLIGLRLSGRCVRGVVLARDEARDLALIQLASVPHGIVGISLAAADPEPAARVHAVSHPTGVEFLWLYSTGAVRSLARVELHPRRSADAKKPLACLLQLPHQGDSSGGPVVNDAGELIGVLASREGPRQELAYAAAPSEIRTFLETARPWWKPETAAEFMIRAAYLSRRGRADSALAALRGAAELRPRDAKVLAELALALARLGQAEEARRVAMAATAEESADSLATFGEVFRLLSDTERAGQYVARALKIDPKCARAYVTRAQLGTAERSLSDLGDAIFIDPNLSEAYRVRAELNDSRVFGGVEKTLADLSRAIELEPEHSATLRKRAILFGQTKEWKKAIGDWARLVDLEPENATNYLGLASAHAGKDNDAATAKSLGTAMRLESAKLADVARFIRDRGKALKGVDSQRSVDWYSIAVSEVRPWLPKRQRVAVEETLEKIAREKDGDRRATLWEKALAEWDRGPVDRPSK